jgi:sugar/nucleoside kinase (ribokinase family)
VSSGDTFLPRGPVAPLSVRTALISAPAVDAIDPTGCGDVFGAAAFARLLSGDKVEPALRHATILAGRNAAFRGARGLASHLRGELVTP